VLVPCFLLFLCFRKATQEIFSELDETKAEPPIFTKGSQRPQMRRRGAMGQPHHRVARPSPWPRHQVVRPVGPPPDAALSPIYFPRREKPKGQIAFPRNILQPPPSPSRDREDPGALSGNLPERGRPSPPQWSPPE
jgi:hypothetical protein